MDSLSEVWSEVETLLSDGISLIPVRDKDEEISGRNHLKKEPYFGWKKYQSEIITKDQLWKDIEKAKTNAVAIICGKVSGNLEVIDIDVKHWSGIDGRLFSDLNAIYPDLFNSLRIHKTPSGGFHILYRISDSGPEGNLKLATKEGQKRAGIETRGEGGYVVAPPSLGYSIHFNNPIPLITKAERDSLITICRSYNEVIKIQKPFVPSKSDNQYYSENPWDHFNNSDQAPTVLVDYGGWKFLNESNNFMYFTRPGKEVGVSASYNKLKRVFYIFTSSTEFEPDSGYLPASVLSILKFAGDKKKTFWYLVEQGYGKIKAEVEVRLVEKAAMYGTPLPKNASAEAQDAYIIASASIDERYPAGVFWREHKKKISISREGIYHCAAHYQFVTYNQELYQIDGFKVIQRTPRYLWDTLKSYIQEEDLFLYEAIANSFEAFVQTCGDYTISRLPELDESRLLKSTKYISYKFFQNGWATIKSLQPPSIEPYPIPLGQLIFEHQIAPRDYQTITQEEIEDSMYYKFLDLCVGHNIYVFQCIGYLIHEYKDEDMGYIIVLTEQCEDPKQGGGSGKNIFASLLGHSTTFKNIPGTQVQFDEKFLQSWNYERILSISDVPKKFDFVFLKELSSGSGMLKKLFQNQQTVPVQKMPKFIISTNFSYEVSDGGIRRRIRPIEFTDFFTRCGGVNEHFGAMFPSDWNQYEWLAYDNICIKSIQSYLVVKGKLPDKVLTDGGWTKQFDQSHMQATREFIQENWHNWKNNFISNDTFKVLYEKFCNENGINHQFRLTSFRINKALSEWATHHGFIFDKDAKGRNTFALEERGREFIEISPF